MKFLFLLCCLLSLNVMASDWLHLKETQNDITVDIDYQLFTKSPGPGCYKCSSYTYAGPLFINVSGPALEHKKEIRVVLTSIQFYSYSYNPERPFNKISYLMDLTRQPEGHFSADFSTAKKMMGNQLLDLSPSEHSLDVYNSGYGGTSYYDQEIAIVIDGQWMKNFTVNLKANRKL